MKNKYPAHTSSWFVRISGTIILLGVILAGLYCPRVVDWMLRDQQTLNVLAFTDSLSSKVLVEFSERTGIRVNLSSFVTDEELIAKVRLGKGGEYDLMVVSGEVIPLIRRYGLAQKLDHTKIKNFLRLDTRLLGQVVDPKNEYSLPLNWTVLGLGYDKRFFGKLSEASWDVIFKQPFDHAGKERRYTVCVMNELRDPILISALYLFGSMHDLTPEKFTKITHLLRRQRRWVESYTSDKQDYFLMAGVSPVVMIPGAYMRRIFGESDNFDFIIPKEGSLLLTTNMLIPATSKRHDATHRLIDYILSKEVSAKHSALYGHGPVNLDSYALLDEKHRRHPAFFFSDEQFKTLHFIRSDLSLQRLEDLWISVKLGH